MLDIIDKGEHTKVKKAIVTALILVLTLAACGDNPAGLGDGGTRDIDADRSFSHPQVLACEAKETVYTVVQNRDSTGTLFQLLYYFDKTTGISGPLCGKPECRHNDQDCNAYLTNGGVYSLTSYDGRLYWIISWEGAGRLYSEAYDGTDRQVVRNLNDGIFEWPSEIAQLHRGYAYMTSRFGTIVDGEEQDITRIVAYPLYSEEEGFVILDEGINYLSIRTQLYEDHMFILTVDESLGDVIRTTFRKWNIETHEWETLFDGEVSFWPGGDFWVTEDGFFLDGTVSGSYTTDVYFYDYSTGEFETRFSFTGEGLRRSAFGDGLFVTRFNRGLEVGIVAQDMEGHIVFEGDYDVSNWPLANVSPLFFAGADEKNLYFNWSGRYMVVIPLDGSEPVIVWNGEM